MATASNSRVLRIIPLLITACHCERSAAIKTRFFVATAVFLVTLVAFPAQAKYGGGSGTANDPYQIATADDLITLGETPEDYDKHFVLTDDIDLAGQVFNKAVIAPDTDRWANGYQGAIFSGTLNGQGHRILNMTISGAGFLGLFGHLCAGSVVSGLGLDDVNIVGTGDYVAGLAALTSGGPTVSDAYSTGTVSGNSGVGGLLATSDGAVTQCCSSAAVSGDRSVGGLVGLNAGDVTHCYSTGAVSGKWNVGGLVGSNGGNVADCYSTGAVSGDRRVGGLVGSGWQSHVTTSFWDMETARQATSAGGTGKTTAEMQMASTFFDWGVCGNEGIWTIDEGKDYPRLAWESKSGKALPALADFLAGSGTEADPYLIYTGEDLNTIAKFPCERGKYFRLAFLTGEGTPEDPYLIETADQIDLLNLCPYERDAHYRLGFVTGEGTENNPYLIETVDQINLVRMCPYQQDAHFRLAFLAGEGTQDSPYLVYMADELNLVGMCPYERGAHFKLMADIDLSAFDGKDGRPAFTALGSSYDHAFTGVFDGGGHTISNFSYTCTETYDIGLFGYVSGPNSVIRNLQLTWPNIDAGTGGVVGALVGYLEGGTVVNCHIDGGSVSGGWQVGGLVGASYGGTITGCSSTATVSGIGSVGGLVGSNGGTISYCDSAGRVLGDYDVGGLVGQNAYFSLWGEDEEYQPGAIYDCYSTAGVLGTGSNCGGLVGSNDAGEVARCYASGIVLGVSTVGGLAGWNGGNISSCYSTADVGGEKDVGGLVGLNSTWRPRSPTTITNCYSAGIVLGDEDVGGLVGEGDVNDVVASFWDTQSSGQAASAGGTGVITGEMQMAKTFLDAGLPDAAGWDFVGESQNGTEDIWAICEGVDYPHLTWEFVIGDFDADADTDFADFCILAEHWLQSDGSFWCGRGCDLTNDGFIDFSDLLMVAENWLTDISYR